jgi:hypothetical protein
VCVTSLEVLAENVYGRVYDTLRGEVYAHALVELGGVPPHATSTDSRGQYWLHGVAPGAYLVRIKTEEGREVIGRLVVSRSPATIIANLDLAKIDVPGAEDEY